MYTFTYLPIQTLVRKQILQKLLLLLVACAVSLLNANAQVYVTQNGGSPQNGTSWATAYAGTSLQNILATSPAGTTVLVGAGLYKPTAGSDRSQSFVIATGVQVYGGYNPATNARTTDPSSTTLSGDLDNDNVLDDGNSYHVVIFNSANSQNRIDGFVITGGNADGDSGGGLYNGGGSANPTIANCWFEKNTASSAGGAIYNQSASSEYNVTITRCTFIQNTAGSLGGGAIYNLRPDTHDPSKPINPILISYCIFKGNSTTASGGGAICNDTGGGGGVISPTITDCVFEGNTAAFAGGAIENNGSFGGVSSPTITRCTFKSNSSGFGGGAIMNGGREGTSSPLITDCTFESNAANDGGAIANYGNQGGSVIRRLFPAGLVKIPLPMIIILVELLLLTVKTAPLIRPSAIAVFPTM